MKENKLVYGVGINDSDYVVQIKETVEGRYANGRKKQKAAWMCPFYSRWFDMMRRCYSKVLHSKRPTYLGCSIAPEWHYFMAFRAWMIEQDWEGKELDKDLLVPGNKIYGPDTCVFVDKKVNNFLLDNKKSRGELPIGVSLHKRNNTYKSTCSDILTGSIKSLGYFKTINEAYLCYLKFKLEQAKILASEQSDPRVAKALIKRYENYAKYFGE